METGFSICSEGRLHGDIEHLYVVHLHKELVEHYKVSFGSDYGDYENLVESRRPDHVYELNGDPDVENIEDVEVEVEEVTAE